MLNGDKWQLIERLIRMDKEKAFYSARIMKLGWILVDLNLETDLIIDAITGLFKEKSIRKHDLMMETQIHRPAGCFKSDSDQPVQ